MSFELVYILRNHSLGTGGGGGTMHFFFGPDQDELV